MQNFTIFDSTDSQGIIHITQYGRDINSSKYTPFFDTTKYIIDTVKNYVYRLSFAGYKSEYDSFLVYKLDAKQGDIWIVYDHSKIGGSGYDLARVMEKKKDICFR